MMLILLMLLYFILVGSLFYKLFISSPSPPEWELIITPEIEIIHEYPKEFKKEPVKPKIKSNEAADINVG